MAIPVVLFTTTPTVSAQQTREALRDHVERLRPRVEELQVEVNALARARADAARRADEARSPTRTLQVGPVTIVARADQADVTLRLFTEVWAEHFSDIEQSSGLSETIFTFQWGDSDGPLPHGQRTAHRMEPSAWVTEVGVKERIRGGIASILGADLTAPPSGIGAWVNETPHREHDLAMAYRHLATAPSKATRACLEGEVTSCMTALGLGIEGDEIDAWYSPTDKQALVVESPPLSLLRKNRDEYRDCVDVALLEACNALLRHYPGSWAPLPGSVRASLLGLALDRGGQGAWERLLQDRSMDAEEALALASGLSAIDLVELWRTTVLENRPQPHGRLGLGSMLATGWMLFFAALAMRSTRWRVG